MDQGFSGIRQRLVIIVLAIAILTNASLNPDVRYFFVACLSVVLAILHAIP